MVLGGDVQIGVGVVVPSIFETLGSLIQIRRLAGDANYESFLRRVPLFRFSTGEYPQFTITFTK